MCDYSFAQNTTFQTGDPVIDNILNSTSSNTYTYWNQNNQTTQFTITLSQNPIKKWEKVDMTIKAIKADWSVDTNYRGTIIMDLEWIQNTNVYNLPSNWFYEFTSQDKGIKIFSKWLKVNKNWRYTLVVFDSITDSIISNLSFIVWKSSTTKTTTKSSNIKSNIWQKSFNTFISNEYGLTISKHFKNTNKYCKTSSLSKWLKISIQNCDKRIRDFIQESYNEIHNPNTNNLSSDLSTIFITLNNIINSNNMSGIIQTQDKKNIINSIIIWKPSKALMTIDQNIAIQITVLEIILNDYLTNNSTSNTITKTNTQNKVQEITITDCRNDYNCFIEQSKTCTPSKLTREISLDLFWSISKTIMYYEIKGSKNNKCNFYLNTLKQDLSYSSEIIQWWLSQWITMDEIKKDLEEKNKENKRIIEGLDWTCNITNNYLTKILNNWKSWISNSKDLTSEFCSWKLFPNNNMTFNLSDKN